MGITAARSRELNWNDVILPGLDYIVIENTMGKFGKEVEVFNHLPINVQSLVGDF